MLIASPLHLSIWVLFFSSSVYAFLSIIARAHMLLVVHNNCVIFTLCYKEMFKKRDDIKLWSCKSSDSVYSTSSSEFCVLPPFVSCEKLLSSHLIKCWWTPHNFCLPGKPLFLLPFFQMISLFCRIFCLTVIFPCIECVQFSLFWRIVLLLRKLLIA